MGKKVYIGVNNIPKNVTKIYVGVNGVARKVIKGYVGVNGVARVFWDGGGSIIGFWFYYSTIIEKIIDGKRYTVVPTQIPVEVRKKNTGIAFYFFIQQIEDGNIIENLVFTVSTDSTATPFNGIWGGQTYPFDSVDSTTVNNDTWYYTIGAPFDYDYAPQYPADISPNCIVKDADLEELYDVEDMVKGFLNRYVYTDDFAEDYQVGQTYNYVDADKEKTLRKAFAILLFKNAPWRTSLVYTTIMSNIESIIARILSEAQGFKYISFFANPVGIAATQPFANFDIYFGNNNVPDYEVKWVREAFGYKFVEAFGNTRMQTSKRLMITINGSTISYRVNTNSQEVQRIGIEIQDLHATTSYYGYRVITSNVGIKFN